MLMRKLRMKRGWSQAKLSRVADLNQSTVNAIERGRLRAGAGQLRALATALKWDGDPEALVENWNGHDCP